MYARTKIIIAVVALLIVSGVMAVILLLTGGDTELSTATPTEATLESLPLQQRRQGNTAGNIANLGLVAQDGDWIYYSLLNIYEFQRGEPAIGEIVRMRRDGSEREVIFRELGKSPSFFNVVGEHIYFGIRGGIRRIRTDGTELVSLGESNSQTSPMCLTVSDNWLYFTIRDDVWTLNRISLYDNTQERISGIIASGFHVEDDWIYYSDMISDSAIYRVRLDGTMRERLSSGRANSIFNVADDWIYYVDHDRSLQLFKMRLDGSEHQLVISDRVGNYNVSNGWIYFASYSNENIYRVRTDGTDRQMLFDNLGFHINVIDEWVFFRLGDFRELHGLDVLLAPLYRMRTDGTDVESLQ
jgi:hypothetical protein